MVVFLLIAYRFRCLCDDAKYAMLQRMEQTNNLNKLFLSHKTFLSLMSDFTSQRFSHGHLFLSSDNAMVNGFALAVAQMIVCFFNSNCGQCEGCRLFNKETHPDVLVYPKGQKFLVADAASIIEQVYIKPLIAKHKVFVLLNFNQANEQSQNKLLKILEEPPEHVVFLVAASNESGVLLTVRSRLSKTSVASFGAEELKNALQNYTSNSQLIANAIFACNNNLGQAIEFVQSAQMQKQFEFAKKIVCEMTKSAEILPFSKELAKDREHFVASIRFLNLILIKMLQAKDVPSMLQDEALVAANMQFSKMALLKILELINESKRHADSYVNVASSVDKLLFGLLEVKYKWK